MRTRRVVVVTLLFFGMAAAPALGQEQTGTLVRIKATGILRWGADASGGAPFIFTDKANPDKVIGFEVDLVERLAARLGVKPIFEQGNWPTLIPSLESKRIDLMLNGLELKDRLAAKVRYTVPYFQYLQQITVRIDDKDKFRHLGDLKGKSIAILNNSASKDVLLEAGWAEGQILELEDSLQPYEVLKDKRVDAVLADSIIADYYAGKDKELYNQPDLFAPGYYVGAVRAEDLDLLKEINFILEEMKHNGELAKIYRQWNIYDKWQVQLGIYSRGGADDTTAATGGTDWGKIALALAHGTSITLLLTAISMPLALVFGLLLALMVRSGHWFYVWPAQLYIQVMRGTPLLVQIFVIFFALPKLGALLDTEWLTWPALFVGILCLSANYAAYEAEIHRAGLDAVPKGQREAALSLGMSERQSFFHIVLPQSFRIIMPPVLNDLISMLKDSCMVSVIGVSELLFVASATGKATFLYGELLLIAALIYLILSVAADFLGKRLEKYLRERGTPPVAAHPPRH